MGFFKRDGKRVEPWKPVRPFSATPSPVSVEPHPETEQAKQERLEREKREAIMDAKDKLFGEYTFHHLNHLTDQVKKTVYMREHVDAVWGDVKLTGKVKQAAMDLIGEIDKKRDGMMITDLESVMANLVAPKRFYVPHFNGDMSKYIHPDEQKDIIIRTTPADEDSKERTWNIYDRKSRRVVEVGASAKRLAIDKDQEIILNLKEEQDLLYFLSFYRVRQDKNEETLNFFCDIFSYELEITTKELLGFTEQDGADRALLGNMFEELIERGLKMKSVDFARDQYDIKLDWQGIDVHLIILPRPKNELFNIEPTFIPNHMIQPNNFTLFPGIDVTHTHCVRNEYVNYCRFTEKKD